MPRHARNKSFIVAFLPRDEATDRLCSDYADAANFLLQLWPYHYAREQIAWLKAGLAAARRVKERGAEISHMGNLGNAYSLRGEQRRAVEYFEQVLEFFRQINDRYHESSRCWDSATLTPKWTSWSVRLSTTSKP